MAAFTGVFAMAMAISGAGQPLIANSVGLIVADCTGYETFQFNDGPVKRSSYELPIQIDLAQGSWCWRQCSKILTALIKSKNDGELVLVDIEGKITWRRDVIDLDNGEFREHYTFNSGTGPAAIHTITDVEAVCRNSNAAG